MGHARRGRFPRSQLSAYSLPCRARYGLACRGWMDVRPGAEELLAVVVAEQEGEPGQVGAQLGEAVALGADEAAEVGGGLGVVGAAGPWLMKVLVSAASAASARSRCTGELASVLLGWRSSGGRWRAFLAHCWWRARARR